MGWPLHGAGSIPRVLPCMQRTPLALQARKRVAGPTQLRSMLPRMASLQASQTAVPCCCASSPRQSPTASLTRGSGSSRAALQLPRTSCVKACLLLSPACDQATSLLSSACRAVRTRQGPHMLRPWSSGGSIEPQLTCAMVKAASLCVHCGEASRAERPACSRCTSSDGHC